MPRISQLRKLTIQPGKLDEFVAAWKKGIVPLRRQQGYDIDAAWIIPERDEFWWILSYSGAEDWDRKEDLYYQSLETLDLHPDPLDYIVRVERWFMQFVEPEP